MKEYYKAAIEAFAQGDHARASKLLEEGQFFHGKAREADEESAQMITQARNGETEDTVSLDLHNQGDKEAIRLLKCHLSSLSGISCKILFSLVLFCFGTD
ncbi:putative nuclear RNA export factor SDE5 [Camellia sinensis]|uniref:putative nuclear RNA export factor SDE5 n=1 Tax=Camellia sinensis TaxID=4442 RepID=UPI0010358096|nr:putative nuclear RNA export factor SDE5 [Camellia sinensis]